MQLSQSVWDRDARFACLYSSITGPVGLVSCGHAGSILSLNQVMSYGIVQQFSVTLESQALHDSIFVERDCPRL